jgi:hypothetical protein
MSLLNIRYLNESGELIYLIDDTLELKVNEYLNGEVSHRRVLHKQLLGGYYVEADPTNWRGSFDIKCSDVTYRQISFLRNALNTSLTFSKITVTFGEFSLFGSYKPNTLKVTSTGSMEDKRYQRNVSFSFSGNLSI